MSTVTTATNPTIAYAPYVTPVSGNHVLACVNLKWTDNPGASSSGTNNSCSYAANTFKKLSNGQLVYKPSAFTIDVPYTHSAGNVGKAVDYAKSQLASKYGIPSTKDTHYIMVNNNAPGEKYSYTQPGGNTSNLLDVLSTTFCHELGRQAPTVLGSSGAFINGKYADQADSTTFMGHFASDTLTASQLYYLGWLPNTEVALYDGSTPTMQFTLSPLNEDSIEGDVKAVYLSKASKKPLFLSRPTLKNHGVLYALHLASNATGSGPSNNLGSERIGVFANKYEYAGLNFEVVSENGSSSTITISPSATSNTNNNTGTKGSHSNKNETKSTAASATQKPLLFSTPEKSDQSPTVAASANKM